MAAMVLLGVAILSLGSQASAVPGPPYTPGASANALVGGAPPIVANCPAAPAAAQGASTNGVVRVANASASCNPQSAAATGQAYIGQMLIPNFASSCQNREGTTNGGVTVPAGSTINGGPPVSGITPVNALNATVVFPNGSTAIVNEVIYAPPKPNDTMVTRNAIRITAGPGAGVIIGRVICGGPYPLAVEVPSPGDAISDLPGQLSGGGGSSSTGLMLAIGLAVLLVAAQAAVAVTLIRRRAVRH